MLQAGGNGLAPAPPLWGYPRAVEHLSFRRGRLPAHSADLLPKSQSRWSIPLSYKPPNPALLNILARTFSAGHPDTEEIAGRAAAVLGRPWHWLRPVARRYAEKIAGHPRLRHKGIVAFLRDDPSFQRAWRRLGDKLAVHTWVIGPERMLPVSAAAGWNLPKIESVGELAAWFNLSVEELEWFADLKTLNRRDCNSRLAHYYYKVLMKQSGGIRLIEAPKQHLRHMQRQILAEILNRIPAHGSVHGFVRGRSIRSFATPHVGRSVILRVDIENFFPSFPGRRIQAFFRTIGYPESVADILGGICTNTVHFASWKAPAFNATPDNFHEARLLYSRPHLPQGAPTSPALANLCSHRLDCRLTGLAESAGATYTRYADDLAFSGDRDFAARSERFSTSVASVLAESGFAVNHHKTRIMRQGVRQHLVGLVANQCLNVPRAEFDRLKATLVNCVRSGWQSQNREARNDFRSYLSGKISFVEAIHAARGLRLRMLFEQIQW